MRHQAMRSFAGGSARANWSRRGAVTAALAVALLGVASGGGAPVAAAEACPNEEIRAQQGSTFLAGCRAYEQVTPVKKNGYIVSNNSNIAAGIPDLGVSPDGEWVTYDGFNPLPGANGGSNLGLSGTRGPAGWRATSILPVPGRNQPGLGGADSDAFLKATTDDQRVSVYYDNTTEPYGSLWISRADGSRQRIADASTSLIGQASMPGTPYTEAISANGRHVIFGDTDALLPGLTPTGNEILYDWADDGSNGGAGTLRVVNRTNSPTLTLLDSSVPAALGGGPIGSGAREKSPIGVRHAVSADGRRIYFQTPPSEEGLGGEPLGGGPLYLRDDGETTVQVSAPPTGYVPAHEPTKVQYLDASTDGDIVFFWANGDLTDSADLEGGIYRYQVGTHSLSFLATAPEVGGLIGLVPPSAMASDDGSYLYYQGGEDLYVHTAGVSTLVRADTTVGLDVIAGDKNIRDTRRPSANISPDGRFFAFISRQAYLYDALTKSLQQVSTGPHAPAPDTYTVTTMPYAKLAPRKASQRFMSDDGRYVFFTTRASLVPTDSNQGSDAYEWHDGRLSLLSSGDTENEGAAFAGTDADGRNAFLVTDQRLVPQDGDVVADIYDARIGGGFPFSSGPACPGGACGAVPSVPSSAAPPGTAGYAGPGNLRSRASKQKRQKQRKRGKHSKRGKRSKQAHHKRAHAARKHG